VILSKAESHSIAHFYGGTLENMLPEIEVIATCNGPTNVSVRLYEVQCVCAFLCN